MGFSSRLQDHAPLEGHSRTHILRGLLFYIGHTVVATLVATAMGFLISMLLALFCLVVPQVRVPLGYVLGEPFFPLQVLSGVILGFLANRRFRNWSAVWVWIPPAANLAHTISTWKVYTSRSYWEDVWAYFFVGTDGLHALFYTAPVYTAIAYSVGAFLALRCSPDNSS
jgi:hypothetical protein